ncbi:dipeptide epimerase [Kordiimonas pumila]|uniref:Dipeptide epimerase n=1 Tax=Kordiimonas pumila TaxID=2161677 RepID=A0ABV7D5W5_9PROT|nr:dipeptide epimerase [Kordiimonas pumila]
MKIKIERIPFPFRFAFTITGYTFTVADTVRVTLCDGVFQGRGEGVGVYYTDDMPDGMTAQLANIADKIGPKTTRADIQDFLPAGGARNALDCAMWDLEAKRAGKSIWGLLGVTPHILTSVATLGIDGPKEMAAAAVGLAKYPNLKVKLSGDDPVTRLAAVRAARPEAKLIIDVNQGWSFDELKEYAPVMKKLGVAMIEQPLPRGADEDLEDYISDVPLGADESCLSLAEYETAARRYDVINIKLDKCGGLTEGLELVKLAKRDGKGLMVGNMSGSSLSMAPAYVLGQYCQFVDIDGPVFLTKDIDNALEYGDGGVVGLPTKDLWG